jgi:hypothetical protein
MCCYSSTKPDCYGYLPCCTPERLIVPYDEKLYRFYLPTNGNLAMEAVATELVNESKKFEKLYHTSAKQT